MEHTDIYSLYFDGCSKGNPGPAGIGAVIYRGSNEIWNGAKFIGNKTNNEAEYLALIMGLKASIKLNIKSLFVFGDSLLVINQITKKYQVRSETLYELFIQANGLIEKFQSINFEHIYRNNNKRADELSNIALNREIDNVIIEEEIQEIQEIQENNKKTVTKKNKSKTDCKLPQIVPKIAFDN